MGWAVAAHVDKSRKEEAAGSGRCLWGKRADGAGGGRFALGITGIWRPDAGGFAEHLGVHATMFGFAHDDENEHAPDEFLGLDAFRRGQEAYCRLFECL